MIDMKTYGVLHPSAGIERGSERLDANAMASDYPPTMNSNS